MAEKEKTSPLEALDAAHLKHAQARGAALDAAMAEMRSAQKLIDEARLKVAALQRESVDASFAYDAQRAELAAAEAKKTRAA